jgi:hypothetical protein
MACELFARAAVHSRRAAKALVSLRYAPDVRWRRSRSDIWVDVDWLQPILNRLREKAHAAMTAGRNDPRSDGALWIIKTDGEEDDELDIFAGRTRLVSSKRPSPSPVSAPAELRPTPAYAPVPPPPSSSASVYPSHPSQPPTIYPPTLPAVPQMRVPESAGASPSSVDWTMQPSQGVPMSAHAYSSEVYSAQRHEGYYLPSQSFTPQTSIAQTSLSQYGWSSQGTQQQQPGTRMHRQPYLPPSLPASAPQQQQQQYGELAQQGHYSTPSNDYLSSHPHSRGSLAGHGTHTPSYIPPAELVNLGLAARDSRLDERWTTFMHESGFLDGVNNPSNVGDSSGHHY